MLHLRLREWVLGFFRVGVGAPPAMPPAPVARAREPAPEGPGTAFPHTPERSDAARPGPAAS